MVRPFYVCGTRMKLYQPRPLNRRIKLLATCLLLSLAFAAWTWIRPYEWGRDAGARYRIVHAALKVDHSFYWLTIHLKREGREPHDLLKPVALILADGRELEPTEFSCIEEEGYPEIGYRFWLEEKDIPGPIRLKINDGTLTVRKKPGAPPAQTGSVRYFTTANW
jgi:hypothetical protein